MKPVKFKECNFEKEGCHYAQVVEQMPGGFQRTVTVVGFKPDAADKRRIAKGGPVFVTMYADVVPPFDCQTTHKMEIKKAPKKPTKAKIKGVKNPPKKPANKKPKNITKMPARAKPVLTVAQIRAAANKRKTLAAMKKKSAAAAKKKAKKKTSKKN